MMFWFGLALPWCHSRTHGCQVAEHCPWTFLVWVVVLPSPIALCFSGLCHSCHSCSLSLACTRNTQSISTGTRLDLQCTQSVACNIRSRSQQGLETHLRLAWTRDVLVRHSSRLSHSMCLTKSIKISTGSVDTLRRPTATHWIGRYTSMTDSDASTLFDASSSMLATVVRRSFAAASC